jgi:hypothetical protein
MSGARVLAALVIATFPSISQGTIIHFDATNVAGNQWLYDYSVTNDTLADPIDEFTIFFDLSLYANLGVFSSPGGWDSLVAQPDPSLPDDGFFDSLALVAGIGTGDTLQGFSVLFDWLGVGAPGAQPWLVVDPLTLVMLDAGVTTQVVRVSEPGTLTLVLLGLLVGWRTRIDVPRKKISD